MTHHPFRLAFIPLCLMGVFPVYAEDSANTQAEEQVSGEQYQRERHRRGGHHDHRRNEQRPAAAEQETELGTVYVTAERQLQQSLGVSKITAKDIEKKQVINDISEVVRTMPGVNLTGNSASGSYGNKRQIDIRGMGPENTLILIDGKPVTSRSATRMTRNGERNTRGDSNWVPAEAIESIEVLRGPAAARYGSGAMGGVVNIITKKTTNEFKGSVNVYTNQPQDDDEGATKRIGFNISGPIIKDVLSYRLYGSLNKTDADSNTINGTSTSAVVAGVEGVRNKDIGGRLHWKISPSQSLTLDNSFSRQGNIYNGDTLYSSSTSATTLGLAAAGAETARLYRYSTSLTHDGAWDWGDTKTYIQFDRTTNNRLPEGLTGGVEGAYNSSTEYTNSILKNYRFSHESYIPFKTGRLGHVLTAGAEAVHTKLDDVSSMRQAVSYGTIAGLDSTNRSGVSSVTEYAAYLEDNIGITKNFRLIPTVRLDYSSKFGSNVSPGLNFSYNINPVWKIKGGIARAYKTPNLYQSNPNYLLFSNGNGCYGYRQCYLQGNADLKPETSINKEIGFEFNKNGWQASAAYFHNNYHNKIDSSSTLLGTTTSGNRIYAWENVGKAVVEGFEGSLVVPVYADKLKWSNNFTYMRRSVNKTTNEPLSIIPKYTINSTLAWTPNERLDANLTYTYYGKQSSTLDSTTTPLPRYGVMGINAGYQFSKMFSGRIGVSNLFDKKFLRTNEGAQTYNQHGRAFYGSLKMEF
ncbi:FepA family TonB-dependent siderophore receptor [Neisseria perflava]|uniref:FepA family TonB-dependent siderophore receptor n=1 Tax=Neisseria perflava TaxID=33053 RepID=UPI0020A001BA|nr:FepA family TonB-dependent siderophore receptor [Neisseria perflava]MCP1659096.1 ferric enterobactin receptor [Neisseria perflava]